MNVAENIALGREPLTVLRTIDHGRLLASGTIDELLEARGEGRESLEEYFMRSIGHSGNRE